LKESFQINGDSDKARARPHPVHDLNLFPTGGDGELEGVGRNEYDPDEEKTSEYPLGEAKDMDEHGKCLYPLLAILNFLELRNLLQTSDHLFDLCRIPILLLQLNFERRRKERGLNSLEKTLLPPQLRCHKIHGIIGRNISDELHPFQETSFVQEGFHLPGRGPLLQVGDDLDLVFPDFKEVGQIEGNQSEGRKNEHGDHNDAEGDEIWE
jgi:hypothetical protein